MWHLRYRSFIRQAALAGLALASGLAVAEEKLSVPVRLLSTASVPNMSDMQRPPGPALPQVTPAARMPQYQLHRNDVGAVANPSSPSVRFLLATPERPLLVEAVIMIDGQPFARPREQRIEKIMSFINDPAAFREAEVKLSQAAPANAIPDAPPEAIPLSTGAEASPPVDTAESTPEEQPKELTVEAIAKYAPPTTIYERIERSMKSTGTKPSAPEVRWMLANWTDGPVLLFLNDNFQRLRAEQQPLFFVLDSNRDQVMSADEIASAVKSLEECDLDRNEVVESTEIAKVASDPRNWAVANRASQPHVLRLDQATSLSTLLPRLSSLYSGDSPAALGVIDTDQDGKLNDNERTTLLERPADLVLRLDLNTLNPEASRLSVVSATDIYQSVIETAVCATNTIRLTFPSYALELSSVQGGASDQISIGAINDGHAMLPELDPNGDGRFTIRERRTLVERLKAFDRNGDHSIASDEIFPTYRLCLALGANAHEPLSTLRRTNSPNIPTPAAPDWFTEMDKNKDLDLSRTEFPGTDEQFQQLDLDSDQLVSASEADQAKN